MGGYVDDLLVIATTAEASIVFYGYEIAFDQESRTSVKIPWYLSEGALHVRVSSGTGEGDC